MNEYTPDYVSPPSVSILERLEELGKSQGWLQNCLEMSGKEYRDFIQGHSLITVRVAEMLEFLLKVPAIFWISRDKGYQEWKIGQLSCRPRELCGFESVEELCKAVEAWREMEKEARLIRCGAALSSTMMGVVEILNQVLKSVDALDVSAAHASMGIEEKE